MNSWPGLLAAALAMLLSTPARQPLDATAYLSEQFGISSGEIARVQARRAVVRSLDVDDGREVATVGAIQLRASADRYIERLRDIAAFKRSEDVVQIGVFSASPSATEAGLLTLPPNDRESLAQCRPGRCKVQLPAAEIDRIRDGVRWRSPHAADDANRLFRDFLAALAADYRRRGDAALPDYADTARRSSAAAEFAALIESPPAVLRRYATLHDHLRNFPGRADDRIEDVLYWSKEKLGPAEVVTLTHLAIQRVDGALPVRYVAASRQLYSTHYFDASLGLTILLSDAANDVTYLVYLNRSRVDVFGGMLGRLKRSLVASRLRGTLERSLFMARDAIERPISTPGGA